jgi:hypothetical protein
MRCASSTVIRAGRLAACVSNAHFLFVSLRSSVRRESAASASAPLCSRCMLDQLFGQNSEHAPLEMNICKAAERQSSRRRFAVFFSSQNCLGNDRMCRHEFAGFEPASSGPRNGASDWRSTCAIGNCTHHQCVFGEITRKVCAKCDASCACALVFFLPEAR